MIQQKWNDCLQIIKDNIGIETYKTLFEPIKAISFVDNILTLEVPNRFYYEFIEENYVDLLRKVIKKELGKDTKLNYKILVGKKNKKRLFFSKKCYCF